MRINYFLPILKKYTVLKDVNKMLIRQGSKTLVGGKVTPLTQNTLLGRMLLYLNNNAKVGLEETWQLNEDSSLIDGLVHGKTASLRGLNVDQITGLFYSANTSILRHNKQHLRKVIELLDVECCLRINSMEPRSILKLLRAFMHIVPTRIAEIKFYQYATDNIDRCLKEISNKELLQFIFYIGLQKKTKKAQVVLRRCLRNINKEFLENLTPEDLCIICNSTYRTNTKISNVHLLEKVKNTLNENLHLLKDPALLVTLTKTIKHNHYQDDDLLSTLSCTIFFNNTVQYYTFTAICHILSLYADHLYYDEELLNLLIEKSIKQLQQTDVVKSKGTYLTEQIRGKDIITFLWAVSVLGYTGIDQKVLEDVIVPKIKQKIRIGEYKNNPEELADCLLYLKILNYRVDELARSVLSQENVACIRESQTKNKLRLNLLLTSIKFEDPQLFNDLKVKPAGVSNFNLAYHLDNRPLLQRVFKILKTMSSNVEMQFEMQYQIPYLNVVGITGFQEKIGQAVNVEVLDDYTCVKNKDCHPSGFMQLKLRILEKLDVPLITVPQKEVDSLSDCELREFLEDEIKLFY